MTRIRHKKPDSSQAPAVKGAPSPRLGYALWQTQHMVERAMDEALQPVGVTLTQAAALLHLHQQPGLSGAELARRLLVTPQSTATLLHQLVGKQWIERKQHPVHRGLLEATITEAGNAVLQKSVRIMEQVDRRIGEGLNEQAICSLHEGLGHCLKSAQDLLGGSAAPDREKRR